MSVPMRLLDPLRRAKPPKRTPVGTFLRFYDSPAQGRCVEVKVDGGRTAFMRVSDVEVLCGRCTTKHDSYKSVPKNCSDCTLATERWRADFF